MLRRAVRVMIAAGALATLAPIASLPVEAQASRIDRERGHVMLRALRKDIEQHYYDSTYRGIDLEARIAKTAAGIDSADSLQEIFAHLAQLTLEFGDSHTLFVPPATTTTVDYGWEMKMVGDTCFVSHVRPKSDAAAQGLHLGDQVLSVNGYQPTRQNFAQLLYVFGVLRPQRGLRIVVRSPGGTPRQLDIASRVRQRPRVLDLTGQDGGRDIWALLGEAEEDARRNRSRTWTIGDDVFLWRLPSFMMSRHLIRDAMKPARDRTVLILDLRGNGGGRVKSLNELLGRFYEKDVTVATARGRYASLDFGAKGTGKDAYTGKLIVLVDAESASAAEIFARTVQLTRRGIVIGDRTAGMVQMSGFHTYQFGAATVFTYGMNLANAEIIMPDGGNLENTGVVPDEEIRPTSADIAAGRDPALARALELAGKSFSPSDAGDLIAER